MTPNPKVHWSLIAPAAGNRSEIGIIAEPQERRRLQSAKTLGSLWAQSQWFCQVSNDAKSVLDPVPYLGLVSLCGIPQLT